MKKINTGYIQDIIEYIGHLEDILEEVSKEEFLQNTKSKLAAERCFEVIGEATKKIDRDFRDKFSKIPWSNMAAFRDVIIHDYDRLVAEVIWDTFHTEIPKLKTDLLNILEDAPNQ
tara:strand:- start:617 stop:964 length:348 start_codon:yes stop_codon:yes gene_type:complete